MYIRFGEECSKIAYLNDSEEVKVISEEGTTEVYAKAILNMIIDTYPVIGLLYDTVDDVIKEREKEEQEKEERMYKLTEDEEVKRTKVRGSKGSKKYKEDNYYLLRLQGILEYINNNYLSDYYGRLDYEGREEEDYLDGNNIWDLKGRLENFVKETERKDRVLTIEDTNNLIYEDKKGDKRLGKDSIVFVIRTMTLKNYLSNLRIGDITETNISIGKSLRGNGGYLFVDFGTDIYVLK